MTALQAEKHLALGVYCKAYFSASDRFIRSHLEQSSAVLIALVWV